MVLGPLDDQPPSELFVTAITWAGARTGIATLPDGARRRRQAASAFRVPGLR